MESLRHHSWIGGGSWLVLDCLDTEQVPFEPWHAGGLPKAAHRGQMDRRLIERSIEVANRSQAFGSRALHAALDSSPLWGAGRVEDTYHLGAPRQRQIRSAACAVEDVGMPHVHLAYPCHTG